MLITYLFEKFTNPDDLSEAAIGDLQVSKYIKLNFKISYIDIYFFGIFSL